MPLLMIPITTDLVQRSLAEMGQMLSVPNEATSEPLATWEALLFSFFFTHSARVKRASSHTVPYVCALYICSARTTVMWM